MHAGIAVWAFDHLIGDHLALGGDFVVAAAHEPLDRKDGVVRVDHSLAASSLAHQALVVLAKGYHRIWNLSCGLFFSKSFPDLALDVC